MTSKIPVFLTIGGSDPSGGAGIQADIRTAALLGCYPCSVITTITAQNSSEVSQMVNVESSLLDAQLGSVLEDFTPDAVKIGMLRSEEAVKVIARYIEEYNLKNVVVDPVVSPTLTSDSAGKEVLKSMVEKLFPLAALVTPNLKELEILNEISKDWNESCMAVLLKGGHGESADTVVDKLFYTPEEQNTANAPSTAFPSINFSHSSNYFHDNLVPEPQATGGMKIMEEFTHKRIATDNTHGTGCVLSSAISCYLALDYDLTKAVEKGIKFTANALKKSKSVKITKGKYGPSLI